MNISTLAKILGVSISELRTTAEKNRVQGFGGRNTRIPYNSALEITKIIRPEREKTFENDDKIYIPEMITVNDLAETMGRPAGMVVKTLVLNGVMATLNEKIDFDTASLIASELGVEIFPDTHSYNSNDNATISNSQSIDQEDTSEKTLTHRSPVVTVMGHVDHGKTTLLDTIRQSNVVAGEAGAITQHISSYKIEFKGKNITFIDTPGHEAFTAMRARGTQIADFIILVVSAVEGPKPQTVEVIERAKLSKTPVIVAINKIDLPNADIEKAKADISSFGLVPEEWGGDTPYVTISAKNNVNIDVLLDTLLLHAEVAELKGQVNCPAQAMVIESHLDPKLGIVTVALVIKDTFRVGDIIRCDESLGKIKRMEDSNGKPIQTATLSEPIMILGLSEVVNVGEFIEQHESQKTAQVAAEMAKLKKGQKRFTSINTDSTGADGEFNIMLKADVYGSLEALKESILKIPQEKVTIVIKSESVGTVTSTDIEFAKTTNSTILSFNAQIPPDSVSLVKNLKVNLIESNIIYEILQWVEEEILRNTKHEYRTELLGKAEVLAVFKSEKSTINVFGGEVKHGKIISGKPLRVIRNGEDIGRFEILELQRNKEKTNEVNISQQFGISVSGKGKIQVGDIIESIDEIIIK